MTASSDNRALRVLHFICPAGFYGAEKWILSLVENTEENAATFELAVVREKAETRLKLCHEFHALGHRVHEIGASSRYDLRVINKLAALLRSRKIDVLHTHGYKSDILGVCAARRADVKTVSTTHGFDSSRNLKLRLYMWLGCKSFRFMDKVVSLTEPLYDIVRCHGVHQDKAEVIKSGVNLKPIKPYMKERPPGHYNNSSSLTMGFIGQMIARKNIAVLIDVFDDLAQKNSELQLQLIGDGHARAELEDYAYSLSTHDRIHFLGFVDEPLEYLRQLDLFVMTSTLEGTPLCLMEAMAMGVPVAAFNIDGVDLLIKQGQTGLVADYGDKATLSAHCARLLAEPGLAKELAAAARQHVLEQFAATRMAQDYLRVYRRLTFDTA